MFYNNNMRPALATVGAESSAKEGRRSLKDLFVRSEQSADDDFNAFGDTTDKPRASAPKAERPQQPPRQQQRPSRPPQKRKPSGNVQWGPIIAIAAVVVVAILLVVLLVAIFSAPGKNVKLEDNVYFSFVDADGKYRVVSNGKVLSEAFDGEVNVVPASDRSFAYIFETVNGTEGSGYKMHILKGTKIETIAATADSIKTFAYYEPGIVYERNDRFHYYSDEDHTPITSDASADNFIISGDAAAVVYTVSSSKESDQTVLKYFYDGASVSIEPYNFTPVSLSTDGKYVYGVFNNSLCCIQIEDKGETYTQLRITNDSHGSFGEITGMNADGNEIIFYTESESKGTISYMYSIKDSEPVQIAAGKFKPVYANSDVACPSTFINGYFEGTAVHFDEETEKDVATVATYFLDKKNGAQKLADTTGKFSPDGDYFYFIDDDRILVRIGLNGKDFASETEQIISDVADFSIIENGDVYIMFEDSEDVGYIYYWNSSTGKRVTVSYDADLESMQVCANSIFFTETDDEGVVTVYVSTEGSAKETASFKSASPVATPIIEMGSGKKGYAYFNDEDGNTKLFYTSNGKKFSKVSAACTIADFSEDAENPIEAPTEKPTEAPEENEA